MKKKHKKWKAERENKMNSTTSYEDRLKQITSTKFKSDFE